MEDTEQDFSRRRHTSIEKMRRVERLRLEGRRVRPESEAEVACQETRKAIADNVELLGAVSFREDGADGIKVYTDAVENPFFLRGDRYTDYMNENFVLMEVWSDTSEENWLYYLRFHMFDNDPQGPCVILERNEDNYHVNFAWERVLGPCLFPLAEEKAQALLHDLQKVVAKIPRGLART